MTINSSRIYAKLNILNDCGNIIEAAAFWLYVVQYMRWCVTSGAGTAHLSGVHEFTPGF